jgi:carbonic anhydrase/acetyltransferase-like protein (isoleucine patch superfamily)
MEAGRSLMGIVAIVIPSASVKDRAVVRPSSHVEFMPNHLTGRITRSDHKAKALF